MLRDLRTTLSSLYGLALNQSYHYATTFSSDSYSMKLLVSAIPKYAETHVDPAALYQVASVMILETLHVAITAHSW